MEPTIQTIAKPNCPVCGNSGKRAYQDLEDGLLRAPGKWCMSTCGRNGCGTYWLDPVPATGDIVKLYAGYPTHTDPVPAMLPKPSMARKFLNAIRASVLEASYGYQSDARTPLQPLLRTLAWLHPAWRDTVGLQVYYLPYVQNGRLLDVGCGGGSAMIDLERRGWKAVGIDFDESAVQNAKQKGLEVYIGDLASQSFPDNSFDAILMSHVIEHVPDPTKLLAECRRILKPGGRLVAFTPNAASQGHSRFGKNWRGLEIPRHLQVFTPRALALAATRAGFKTVRGRTTLQGMSYIWNASLAMEQTGSFDLLPVTTTARIKNIFFWFLEGWRYTISPGREETALLYCEK